MSTLSHAQWSVRTGTSRLLPWRPPWFSVALDGEGAILYLIIIGVVVAAVIAFFGAVLSVGVFVLAGVAITGFVVGVFQAMYNFGSVLIEAHQVMR